MYYGRPGGRTSRSGNNLGTNHNVADAWAGQLIPRGKSHNGNFWFDGSTLYSYEEPVAVITDAHDPDGKRVVILTSQTFSVTTSGKHMNPARGALHRNVWRCFYLPYVGDDNASIEMNMRHLLDKYDTVAKELMNARITSLSYYVRNLDPFALRHLDAPLIRRGKVVGSYPYVECEGDEMEAHVRERLTALFTTAWEFAHAFALPRPRKNVDADVANIMDARRAREIAHWHPTKVRARTTHYARDLMREIIR